MITLLLAIVFLLYFGHWGAVLVLAAWEAAVLLYIRIRRPEVFER